MNFTQYTTTQLDGVVKTIRVINGEVFEVVSDNTDVPLVPISTNFSASMGLITTEEFKPKKNPKKNWLPTLAADITTTT
jgi:hypothetical protein